MTRTFRLATADDAEELLALTLRAYAPIRELGIHFAAATADLALVKKNIHNHACYVLEEDGQIQATVSLRMPWGPQPGPFGLPHIWWFAVDPDIGKKRRRIRSADVGRGGHHSGYVEGSGRFTRYCRRASVAVSHVRTQRLRACRRSESGPRPYDDLFPQRAAEATAIDRVTHPYKTKLPH